MSSQLKAKQYQDLIDAAEQRGRAAERAAIVVLLREYISLDSAEKALRHPVWTQTHMPRDTAEKLVLWLESGAHLAAKEK